ncbi:MAG: tRNA preQ1(34) S-adenosylmethionine ribosyltransferase-isomerase QueA, partial [Burkholderiaceae bacterium]|nr:tRNA preQ1(34) S-adenosylmethionine ribosyltransferase-isomerase QueA [Burkholderiaceae bacterium]
ILSPGDLLVLNDTRVTARRLMGRKPTGAFVEVLVLGPTEGGFTALVKPGRRLREGSVIDFSEGLSAEIVEIREGGVRVLSWRGSPSEHEVERVFSSGETPLPPYIHASLPDDSRYQTVYASVPGSAAAPTAGLHFTEPLLERLTAKGIEIAYVTLNVGLDTFKPVQSEDLGAHVMHGEQCTVSRQTREAVMRATGRIVAVGTTTVRTLESWARSGQASGDTNIFITPGFRFQLVDVLLTNFHLPKSTLMMLVSAFAGYEPVMALYRHAIAQQYRFFSYGDAMLLERQDLK